MLLNQSSQFGLYRVASELYAAFLHPPILGLLSISAKLAFTWFGEFERSPQNAQQVVLPTMPSPQAPACSANLPISDF